MQMELKNCNWMPTYTYLSTRCYFVMLVTACYTRTGRLSNTPNHVRDKTAAKYFSEFEIEDELSQKAVEQLRGLLKGKGLPMTGNKKVLIQRLVDDYNESKTAVKSEPSKESPEDMNFAKFSIELPPATNAKQL